MRFARIVSAYDQHNSAVDRLVASVDLDLLQLDYVWPHTIPAGPMYAVGLLHQLRTLHKTLYLNPSLHLITNAGGGDPRGCVEAVAEFLCEHGDAKLPVTAIRGDNVLPCLEELMSTGIELRDVATGITVHELTQPPLFAHVEIGAGPLATAWDEGSRLVVAGCYDLAAPMVATAVSALQWSWDSTDKLAQLALAAHLPQIFVDMDQNNRLAIHPQPAVNLDTEQLRQLLLETAETDGCLRHADVDGKISEFELQKESPDTFGVTGVHGLAASGEWLLRLTYQQGYFAEALFECRDVATEEKAASELQALLAIEKEVHRTVQLDLLSTEKNHAPTLIRLRCQSPDREPCVDFVSEVSSFSLQAGIPGCELTGSPPSWQPKLSQLCCPVPRDAIAVSVDTRPAKEWR